VPRDFVNGLFGEGGNDHLWGDAGNDDIDGGGGTDYAHYTGTQANYQITTSGGVTEVKDLRGRGSNTPDGIDHLVNVERLVFGDGTFKLLVPDQRPDAVNDLASTNEDTAINIAVLGNDTDPDHDALSIISLSDADPIKADFQTELGATISIVNGQVRYDPTTSEGLQALNTGDSRSDSFSYTVSDGFGGTDTGTVTIAVNGSTDLAGFLGQQMNFQLFISRTSPPAPDEILTDTDFTVGPGVELPNGFDDTEKAGTFDISTNSINYVFDNTSSSSLGFGGPFYARFSDKFGTITPISSVTLSTTSGVTNLDPSDLTYDANNIWLNMEGVFIPRDAGFTLDVVFA
jgi:VCBS repeat-containing protein